MRLNISARSSHLARLQAYQVGDTLKQNFKNLSIEYHFRESLGDKNLAEPLWKMPEKGVFTEDFYQDLISEKTDLVVHSWKDLPTERHLDTIVCGTLPRADQRDLLLFKKSSIESLKNRKTVHILSSSQRRIFNLEKFLLKALPFQPTKISFKDIRGNIPTRIEKFMLTEGIDGLVLAKAAVDRLLMDQHPEFAEVQNQIRQYLLDTEFMVLPLSENPNAAAQGAIAIEVKKDRHNLIEMVTQINHPPTFDSALKERDVLASYGGGCHQKIGIAVLKRDYGDVSFLKGLTDQNEILNNRKIDLSSDYQRPKLSQKKISLARVQSLFERTQIDFLVPLGTNAFYVSRISAYRNVTGIIWAAGVETWKKLAEKNVWVHGCSDSLGESEDMRLEALVTCPLKWAKLTHKDTVEGRLFNIATYRLNLKRDLPEEVLQAENFFWMSAYQFDMITEKYPEIKNRTHCCGVGQTYGALKRRLAPLGKKPYLFFNEEEWRNNE